MIKNIILALCVAAVMAAPQRNGEPNPCTEEEIAASNGCMGPKDCMHPHPNNCNKFIKCEVNADGKTGRPTQMDCPAGLEWNDNKKECDWEGTCGAATSAPTTGAPTTGAPTTGAPASSAQPSTGAPSTAEPSTGAPASSAQPSTGEPSTAEPSSEQPSSTNGGSGEGSSPSTGSNPCTEEEIAATNGCVGPKDCMHPDPTDCGKFIKCEVNADGKTGRPTSMICPAGLQWNDNKKECDWPSSSTCGGPASTSEPSTGAPPSSAEPSTASPSTAEPSTGAPASSAQPSTGAPSTAEPSSEQPSSTNGGSGEGSSPSTGSNPCTEEEIAATNGCVGPKDCMHPDPTDCGKFIKCEVNADGKTGRPTSMICPPGLQWNDNKKECDWPSSSTCGGAASSAEPSTASSAEPSTASPSTASPSEVTTASETTTPAAGNETTSPTSETTPEQTTTQKSSTPAACRPDDDDNDDDLDLDTLCGNRCNGLRVVAHPTNNAKYVVCASTNSVQKCAPGLLWSNHRASCTYAGLVSDNGPASRL